MKYQNSVKHTWKDLTAQEYLLKLLDESWQNKDTSFAIILYLHIWEGKQNNFSKFLALTFERIHQKTYLVVLSFAFDD